jgi:hypothetical protein
MTSAAKRRAEYAQIPPRFWGKTPVYNLSIENRPEYGAVAAPAGLNPRNVATVQRLQAALARIQLSTNGGKHRV